MPLPPATAIPFPFRGSTGGSPPVPISSGRSSIGLIDGVGRRKGGPVGGPPADPEDQEEVFVLGAGARGVPCL